jgi:hypothetical protein
LRSTKTASSRRQTAGKSPPRKAVKPALKIEAKGDWTLKPTPLASISIRQIEFELKGQPRHVVPSTQRIQSRGVQRMPLPLFLSIYDLESLRVGDGLCGMTVRCLRFMFGLKDQRYPSVLAGLEMETEAIWNHLDFINLNVHVAPPP